MSGDALVPSAYDGQGMTLERWMGGTVRALRHSGRTDDMTWNGMLLEHHAATFRATAELTSFSSGLFVASLVAQVLL